MSTAEANPTVVALRPEDIQAIISSLATNPQVLAALSERVSTPTPQGRSQILSQESETSQPSTSGKLVKKKWRMTLIRRKVITPFCVRE